MMGHKAPISGIAAAGEFVATAGYDNQVILWSSADKHAIARGCHDHLANQCEFSPDGKWLVSSSSDYSARLWSVPDMRLKAVLTGHGDDVEGVAFHPHEQLVATASRDHSLMIFDFEGRIVRRLVGHGGDVLSVAWRENGRQLVSSSDDGTVKRWDAATGEVIETIEFGGVETDTVAIAADGAIFAGNDEGQLILIWEGRQTSFDAHRAGIKRVVYDESAGRLVTLSYDRSVRIWSYREGAVEPMSTSSLPPSVWPRSCAFLKDEKVAFVTFGSSYATLDLRTLEWDLDEVKPTGGVNGAAFHEGKLYTVGDAGFVQCGGTTVREVGSLCNFIVSFGPQLLCGGQMGSVFNAVTGEIYHQHHSPLNCAVRITDRGMPGLLIGTYTGEALLFHLHGAVPAFIRTIALHENAVKGLAANDTEVFSVCATGAAAVHRIGSWDNVLDDRRTHEKIANGCTALPGGRFASVSRDLRLRIWTSQGVRTFETPHRNSIKCCASNADGSLIATGDYAGRVGIFDTARGEYIAFRTVSASGISSVLPADEAHGFLATSYDGDLYEVHAPAHRARLVA